LFNGFEDDVFIGPIDRNGNKQIRAINYKYEGVYWRVYNMLSMLYPRTLIIKGNFKFNINKSSPEYTHLLNSLNLLTNNYKIEKLNNNDKIIIKTKLWDHQQKTVNKIIHGYTVLNKKGYGDASYVGAGKTLTALSTIEKLFNYNNDNGYLVLVPTEKLYKTWLDEINKHSIGINILIQTASGKLINNKNTNKLINGNTIVISTLGRMRNHPLIQQWNLVIIDECLSVQNKEALQTEEAFRQVMCSKYGVLMLSATFFRSRFDKMFYMLSMLDSGLPNRKEYLDTILNEHIVCHIPEKSRKWITNIEKYKLSKKQRKEYDNIKNKKLTSEKMYVELSKYIYDNVDYVTLFENKIKQFNKKDKILIYCKSKIEADKLCKLNNISRYPNKTLQHVAVSYAEGTYGLNDLIDYNILLTRPPEPDKLPQMKGRLDRPGQKNDILQLEYILLENTVEEAWLYRLEICNSFYNNYLMPLAEFYELAIKN
jgi:hypothetical protein